MIKAVYFDLDGTLYDRDLLVQNLIEEQFRVFQDDLQIIGKPTFIQRVIALDDHGYGDKAELYARLAAEWNLSPALADRLLSHFWSSYTQHCVPFEDAHATLQELENRRIKLGVITNGQTKWQQQKLDSLGIAAFFDVVLISEAEGIRKPDRAIFDRALMRFNVQPAEAMFVGDHPDVDVAGAKNAGMAAVWKYVPYWEMNVDGVPTIRNLSELLPICVRPELIE